MKNQISIFGSFLRVKPHLFYVEGTRIFCAVWAEIYLITPQCGDWLQNLWTEEVLSFNHTLYEGTYPFRKYSPSKQQWHMASTVQMRPQWEAISQNPSEQQCDACSRVMDVCLVMLRSNGKQFRTYSIILSGLEHLSGKSERVDRTDEWIQIPLLPTEKNRVCQTAHF